MDSELSSEEGRGNDANLHAPHKRRLQRKPNHSSSPSLSTLIEMSPVSHSEKMETEIVFPKDEKLVAAKVEEEDLSCLSSVNIDVQPLAKDHQAGPFAAPNTSVRDECVLLSDQEEATDDDTEEEEDTWRASSRVESLTQVPRPPRTRCEWFTLEIVPGLVVALIAAVYNVTMGIIACTHPNLSPHIGTFVSISMGCAAISGIVHLCLGKVPSHVGSGNFAFAPVIALIGLYIGEKSSAEEAFPTLIGALVLMTAIVASCLCLIGWLQLSNYLIIPVPVTTGFIVTVGMILIGASFDIFMGCNSMEIACLQEIGSASDVKVLQLIIVLITAALALAIESQYGVKPWLMPLVILASSTGIVAFSHGMDSKELYFENLEPDHFYDIWTGPAWGLMNLSTLFEILPIILSGVVFALCSYATAFSTFEVILARPLELNRIYTEEGLSLFSSLPMGGMPMNTSVSLWLMQHGLGTRTFIPTFMTVCVAGFLFVGGVGPNPNPNPNPNSNPKF